MYSVVLQERRAAEMADEDNVFDWIYSLPGEELAEVMDELELKPTGLKSEKFTRLQKWLLGDYTAADFVESIEGTKEEIRVKREEKRVSFIARSVWEKTGSTILDPNYTQSGEHPLAILVAEDEVHSCLLKIREDGLYPEPTRSVSERQNSDLIDQQTSNGLARSGISDQDGSNSGSDGEQTPDDPAHAGQVTDNAQQASDLNVVLGLLGKIVDEFDKLRGETQKIREEHESLKRRVDQQSTTDLGTRQFNRTPGRPISSTRMDQVDNHSYNDSGLVSGTGTNQHRVAFQLSQSSSPKQSDAERSLRKQIMDLQRELDRVTSEKHLEFSDSALGPSERTRTPNRSQRNDRKPTDVGNIVRRWNISFDGEPTSSIENFLTQVEENNGLSGLSEDDLLNALPIMLKGVASTWFRSNKRYLKTWAHFCAEARQWYGVCDFQNTLKSEALARTQGEGELVRDYIINLQSYLQKIDPPVTEEQQVDLMVRNMQPALAKLIRRDEAKSVKDLMSRATEIERADIDAKYFRPPPSPAKSILPHLAWGPKKSVGPPRTQVAAVATYENPTGDLVSDIVDALFKRLNKGPGLSLGKPRGSTGSRNSSPGGQSGKPRPRPEETSRKESTRPPQESSGRQRKGRPFDMSQKECYLCHEKGHIRPLCPKKQEN